MNLVRTAAVAATLSLALSACGGGGGSNIPSVPSAFNPNTTGIAPNLVVQDWGSSELQGATYVGPASNAHISVNVLVHQQNGAGLVAYAQSASTPGSANYRQWLTPQQIAQRFGASQSDYQKAAQYFVGQGLAVAGWPQRMVLTVAGSQSTIERAFGVKFGVYSRAGQQFVAPLNTPHFASQIPVDSIGHIVTWRPDHAYMIPSPPHATSGFAAGYSAPVVRAGFDYAGAYSSGYTGTGITLGIIGTGPIDVGGSSGDVDLDALAAATNVTGHVATVTQIPVTPSGVTAGLVTSGILPPSPSPSTTANPAFPYSGDFASPPPVTSPNCSGTLPTCNPEDGEAQLDVQQASTLAPGAAVHFYLAYNAADCDNTNYPTACVNQGTSNNYGPAIGITESDPEIQQVIADNTADVVSISYGGGESQQGFTQANFATSYPALEFAAMASEGMAVFVSSGDYGSAECLGPGNSYLSEQCVSYPSGDPNVSSVGGATTPLDQFGNATAPFLAWGISTGDITGYGSGGAGSTGGSGGGTSTMIAAPAWQQSALGAQLREQPDVAMDGDPNTGVTLMQNSAFGGTIGGIGGTSVAAPDMAAMWADVLSACKAHPGSGACAGGSGTAPWRLGNAAPYFYAIYKGTAIGSWTTSLPYGDVFYDILYGDNQMNNPSQPVGQPIPGYAAMTGYDEVTGVGVPYAGHLIQALTGIATP